MKDLNNYISSGILELYVYGVLSPQESEEVTRLIQENPALLKEVEEIEKSLMSLSAAVAPRPDTSFEDIEYKIKVKEDKVVSLSRKRTSPILYIGWAASVALAVGLGYMLMQNKSLTDQLREAEQEQIVQEGKIQVIEEQFENTSRILKIIRSSEAKEIALKGQSISPDSYATVYWDASLQKTIIDISGLPAAPEGKVYQVWSLTLNPLTPTSLGILDRNSQNVNDLFELNNSNQSEAFGITLEPEGGSISPTLEQLYVLGTTS